MDVEVPRIPSNENSSHSIDETRQSFHLFNCDSTYNLDVIETWLLQVKPKLNFDILVIKHYFSLSQISEMCSTKIPGLRIDFAVFVVHANESRLSINEDNAGIGYAKIYRALMQATGEKVIVVIGGDDNYKNESEEDSVVLSRWARRKISSQFKEEFLDGRKSFVFSWNKKHRAIHEEALLHYFSPEKAGKRFEYQAQPKVAPARLEEEARSILNPFKQTSEVMVKPSNVKENEDTDKEHCGTKEVGIQEDCDIEMDYSFIALEDKTDTRVISKDLGILCRHVPEIADVRNFFGLLSIRPDVLSGTPSEMQCYLENNSLKVCVILLGASNVSEVISREGEEWPLRDVLRTAQRTVVNKVIVIICSDRSLHTDASTIPIDEASITKEIERLLGAKGLILWWKGGNLPIHIPTAEPVVIENERPGLVGNMSGNISARPAKAISHDAVDRNKAQKALLLRTFLHYGNISYDNEDVMFWRENWTPPKEITRDLLEKWKRTPCAELRIYRVKQLENETFHTSVTEIHTSDPFDFSCGGGYITNY